MRCLTSVALLALALCQAAYAQDDYDDYEGVFGFTTLAYDQTSGKLTIYAETDADPYNFDYYSPALEMYLYNNEGYVLNSSDLRCTNDTDGESYASVSCSVQANPNDNYTATTNHWVGGWVVDYVEGGHTYYDDAYGYSTFAPGNTTPLGQIYTPPLVVFVVKLTQLYLGKTTNFVTTVFQSPCLDERDVMIKEYTTYFSDYHPTCSDFTNPFIWPFTGGFSYTQLTPSQGTGQGQFAILQGYMANNLRSVFNVLGNSPNIGTGGGYRSPSKEYQQSAYFPNSRHMAGDAVDLVTGSSKIIYGQQRAAAFATNTSACVEPVDPTGQRGQTTYNHTHIDWRLKGVGHFPPTTCTKSWSQ